MDERPEHLKVQNEKMKAATDDAIEEALEKLKKKAIKNELKATIKNLAELANVSVGSINNREWAKLRIKSIKETAKSSNSKIKPVSGKEREEKSENTSLRYRIKHLIYQNALLYDEVLCLQENLHRAKIENEALNRRINMKAIK